MISGARCLARLSYTRCISLERGLPLLRSSYSSSWSRVSASKATSVAASATPGSGTPAPAAAVGAANPVAATMARPDHSSLSNNTEVVVRHSHFGALYGW
jgi:hypothetical protein